jgi:hypothetical protein
MPWMRRREQRRVARPAISTGEGGLLIHSMLLFLCSFSFSCSLLLLLLTLHSILPNLSDQMVCDVLQLV